MGDAERFLSEVGLIQYFSQSVWLKSSLVDSALRFLSDKHSFSKTSYLSTGLYAEKIHLFAQVFSPFVGDDERFLSEVGLIQYFFHSVLLKSSHCLWVMTKDFSLR